MPPYLFSASIASSSAILPSLPAAREAAINAGKDIPVELRKVFEATDRYGNPLGENPRKRADWAKEAGVPVPIVAQLKRPVDVLWYVGSYPSFHPRGMDGRIDDPKAGWKGRGLWSSHAETTPWHQEGGKGELPKVIHVQIRPDPLAK